MTKYERIILERVIEGGLPAAYNPFNKKDINEVIVTITANANNINFKGGVVIFEYEGEMRESI